MQADPLAAAEELFEKQQYGSCLALLTAGKAALPHEQLVSQRKILQIHQDAAQKQWHQVGFLEYFQHSAFLNCSPQ